MYVELNMDLCKCKKINELETDTDRNIDAYCVRTVP